MKIVIDTNVIASALLFGGRPLELVNVVANHECDAAVSMNILEEYQEIYERLSIKYPTKRTRFSISLLLHAMEIVVPHSHIDACRDPDDNKFLECAIDSNAIYIVSGDSDLLSMRNFQEVLILTVNEFLDSLT